MKKLAIATLATLIATVALSTGAQAGWQNSEQDALAGRFEVSFHNDNCFASTVKNIDRHGYDVVRQLPSCN